MGKIAISASGDHFVKDGKPFFLLSDTDWMAFQKLSLPEWEELVAQRRQQGFNALQISVLPIAHDNSSGKNDIHPFAVKDGKYQFDTIEQAYFDKAVQMLEIMEKYDMTPFLHLFWANYIPDTWAAAICPDTVIPFAHIRPLATYFVKLFDRFDPIYSVSGDTHFETEQVITYYLEILAVLHELAPDSLTTFHLQPWGDPPEVLRRHPQYHFYAYQSGHSFDEPDPRSGQTSMLTYSGQFLEKAEKKPIVNTEPCYEGHSYGHTYGRFTAQDVRRAAWMSLLSGAKAGVSYGAHGVWQMYHRGEPFNNAGFSGMPFNWRAAVQFPGAWDMGYAKWLFEAYGLFDLKPSDAIEARSVTVRMAESENTVAVYAPHPDEFTVQKDLSGYAVCMIALQSKTVVTPFYEIKNGKTKFYLTDHNEDTLMIAQKK